MSDIKALGILSDQIDNFRKLPEPPTSFEEAEAYTGKLRKTSDEAQKAVEKVKAYLENIEEKIEKLRAAQKDLIKRNQDAIQKIFSQFKPSTHFDERARKPIVEKMKAAIELEKATRELMNHRLNELIDETELVCGRVQDGASLLSDDIDGLQGCLNSWRDAKVQSYNEEKRKEAEERRRREEEEKRRKEDEERRKREEEEKRKREEEERRKREQEEAERRAEEERRRREEEERLRREEEERRKREEEERIKREAEEKRLREEEERRRREEEQARKKEEARRRREEERREQERLRKEAEEKAWRQDPNNWKPMVYERPCDEVDGRREYHGGITSVLTSPPGGIEKDDLECFASDEVDSIITVLDDDEKPVSSQIEVHSKKESLHTEVPSRLYVPHNRILSPSDEIVIKISKDGNDWMTYSPVQPTSNMSELEKTSKRLAGIEVNDFTILKIIVVSRPKSQTIIVDRPGISVYSAVDNQVKLFVPRDTFESKTEMRMMVQAVGSDTLSGLVKDNPSLENVLSVSSLIALVSKKSPRKSIEVDLLKASTKQGTSRSQRGRFYQLYACRDKTWRIADVEYKGQQNNVTVSLPVGRDKITIMELEVSANVPKENIPGIAETLQACINKTASVLVVKQKSSNPKMCAVRIIRKEDIKFKVDYLESIGFDEGPGISGEFKVKEGQAIELICTGNIETDPEQKIELEYMSYKGGAGTMFTVRVKDVYKQKDLPSFVGNIRCLLLRGKHFDPDNFAYSVEMTISLPKPVRPKSTVGFVMVRFPFYLASLASYLAREVRNETLCNWQAVMKTLMGEKEFEKGHRNAKRKFDESANDAILFKAVLLDWMKAQQKHDDKLQPIMGALQRNGLPTLAHRCEEFVGLQKECLSDVVLKEISINATKSVRAIGHDLGLNERIVDKCLRAQKGDTPAQIEALLIEWRETDNVLQHDDVKKHLISVCN